MQSRLQDATCPLRFLAKPVQCRVGFLFGLKLPVSYPKFRKILANCTLVASDSIIFSKALYKMPYITGHADLVTTGCFSEFPILIAIAVMFVHLKSLLVFIKCFSIIKMQSGQRVGIKEAECNR